MLRRRSLSIIVGSCLFALLCCESPVTWWRLYLEKVAENAARSEQTRTDCFSGKSFWRLVGSSIQGLYRTQPDVCHQYFKDALIDPRYQVPFTLAITTTIAESFLGPLEILGASLAKFINAFYGNMPPLMAPIATILLILFGVIGLLLQSRYRFRIFGIFTLEPGAHAIRGEYVEQQPMIQQQQQPMIQQQQQQPMIQQQPPIRAIAESSTASVSTIRIVELPDEPPPPPDAIADVD